MCDITALATPEPKFIFLNASPSRYTMFWQIHLRAVEPPLSVHHSITQLHWNFSTALGLHFSQCRNTMWEGMKFEESVISACNKQFLSPFLTSFLLGLYYSISSLIWTSRDGKKCSNYTKFKLSNGPKKLTKTTYIAVNWLGERFHNSRLLQR